MSVLRMSERPFVSALLPSQMSGQNCFVCFKQTHTLCCSKCKAAFYCSKECQAIDWKTNGCHRRECLVFAAVRGSENWDKIKENTELRLVARILARRAVDDGRMRDGKHMDGFPTQVAIRNLWNLTDFADMENDNDYWLGLGAFTTLYRSNSGFFNKISDKQFKMAAMYACSRLLITHMQIQEPFNFDFESVPIGVALYLQSTVFKHSCRPHLSIHFRGSQLIAKSLAPAAPNLHVCRLTYNYFDLDRFLPTKQRRMDIHKTTGLHCSCAMCLDFELDDKKLLSINRLCGVCQDPLIFDWRVNSASAKCQSCDKEVELPTAYINGLKIFWGVYNQNYIDKQKLEDPELAKKLLKMGELFLHPLRNVILCNIRMDVLEFGFQLENIEEKQHKKAIAMLKAVVCTWEYYQMHVEHLCHLYLQLASLYCETFNSNSVRLGILMLDKCSALCQRLYGEDHPLVHKISDKMQHLRRELTRNQ